MANNKYTRKLRKISKYTYALVLPKEVIDKYGWRERQKIEIKDAGRGKLEIRDWRKR